MCCSCEHAQHSIDALSMALQNGRHADTLQQAAALYEALLCRPQHLSDSSPLNLQSRIRHSKRSLCLCSALSTLLRRVFA